MESKFIAENIIKDIRNKVSNYFFRGFDSRDLIILIPARFFDLLAGFYENEVNFTCENPTDSTENKTYIFGIEIKPVSGLDDIYVSLK